MQRNVILPVFLRGCDAWSLALGEQKVEGVWKRDAEEDIWAQEGGSKKQVEKMAIRRTAWFAPLTKYYSGAEIKED